MPSLPSSSRARFIVLPLVCAAIPLVGICAAEWMAVAPRGSAAPLTLATMLVFPALAAAVLFVVGLICLCFRRSRRWAAMTVLCSITYCTAFVAALQIGRHIRTNAFHRLAERSTPLVAAIRAYEQKHGSPPDSLEALVPEFIPSVPSTGIGAYPEYRYYLAPEHYDGNPWVLIVFTPSGVLNFDQFMYFPLGNYPRTGYGGWLERVGDWAYVHE